MPKNFLPLPASWRCPSLLAKSHARGSRYSSIRFHMSLRNASDDFSTGFINTRLDDYDSTLLIKILDITGRACVTYHGTITIVLYSIRRHAAAGSSARKRA